MSDRAWMPSMLVVGALAYAVPSFALDPWEGGVGDDSFASLNAISHGGTQIHDLDQNGTGTNDDDWIGVATLARHSYEARLSGGNSVFDWGACAGCAHFQRVNVSGAVLTGDVSVVNEAGNPESFDRSVRWIATTNTNAEFLRVRGHTAEQETSANTYTVRFWDTTYAIPRWNASNGQVTVVVVSNLVQATLTGNIYFYNPSGALVADQPFTLAQNATVVVISASIPGLAGLSGHAQVVHTGGYGALSGKAVALEPATGFTFDTAMTAIPQ
jgi:hypothetical protein